MPKISTARKRDRYVPNACNRCRTAKVRCNGKSPCSYCIPRDPESCSYRSQQSPREPTTQHQNQSNKIDSTEEQSLKSLLQQQNNKLDTLLKHISNIHQPYRFQNGRSRSPRNLFSCCEAPLPLIQSATSAFFCLHVIDVKLRALEIHTENAQIQDGIKAGSSSSFSILHDQILDGGVADIEAWDGEDADINSLSPTADNVSPKAPTYALETLKSAEVIRLIQKYQDIAGMMYPVVDATHPEQLVENVWANRSADKTNTESLSRRNRSQIGIVEMMVAIALTDENEDSSELMQALHDHVLPDVQYMVWNTRVDLQGLVLLVLVSLYYYYTHKWRKAWRFIRNVVRIILELGLNRRIVLDRSFPDPKAHTQALNTMWAVFVLEQQLRYALGLSTTMQDFFMDPTLPKPVNAPYLEAMIHYARIGAKACETLSCDEPNTQVMSGDCQDAYTYFQYRLSEWRKAISTQFQFKSTSKRADQWNTQLDAILRLRANNLHFVVTRFMFFEREFLGMVPADLWSVCMDVAADTTCILATIDGSPEAYQATKSESNYFLVSSMGISFLAMLQGSLFPISAQSPLDPETCLRAQQSAILCLNLLRNRAESSRQSKHLWNRVSDLASRLNLLGFLAPVAPGNIEDVSGTAETMSINETCERHTGHWEQGLAGLSPSVTALGFPVSENNDEGPTSASKIYSAFDIMFGPDSVFNGIDE
ncbi:Zn(2)-C6 fungal-type domain-containing protein [Trichoderma simmonsii]|uniref:Zn(2)-C6 fungal-type domain-containing protein n=1 Tax=Trichoderma simmonsii TaxID=1491479 RepID=A0A8G0LGJ4_9HYPO|nr:Zn(2)-C6 fungal-type domain-containing protein [Trichoderma simmonsii]